MDISNINLGDTIPELKCPKCKTKGEIRKTGNKSDTSYVECFSCFWGQWINPKNVQLTYEEPKEDNKKKRSKKENNEQDDE